MGRMGKGWLKYLCIIVTVVTVTGIDYCSLPCVGETPIKNVGCGDRKQFARGCSKDAELVVFDIDMINTVLEAHNYYRNHFAGGNEKRFRPACRMGTVEWDNELADLAEVNVRSCLFDHDQCRRTSQFEYPGQNLIVVQLEPHQKLNTEDLYKSLTSWYFKSNNADQSDIDCFPTDHRYEKIGHFTSIVVDRSIRIGCAAGSMTKDFLNEGTPFTGTVIVCNHSSIHWPGHPVYQSCNTPGELCETGRNNNYTNLCSPAEKYDVNKFYYADDPCETVSHSG